MLHCKFYTVNRLNAFIDLCWTLVSQPNHSCDSTTMQPNWTTNKCLIIMRFSKDGTHVVKWMSRILERMLVDNSQYVKELNKRETTKLYVGTWFVHQRRGDFFAQSGSSFWILQEYFLNFLHLSHCNNYRYDRRWSWICILNIFSIIFLGLYNQPFPWYSYSYHGPISLYQRDVTEHKLGREAR